MCIASGSWGIMERARWWPAILNSLGIVHQNIKNTLEKLEIRGRSETAQSELAELKNGAHSDIFHGNSHKVAIGLTRCIYGNAAAEEMICVPPTGQRKGFLILLTLESKDWVALTQATILHY